MEKLSAHHLLSEICQSEALLFREPNSHRVSNAAAHGKDLMHVVGVTGKGQEKAAARFDHQLLEFEDDFAAFECLIQVIDRRHVALGRVIGDPIAVFVLPTIVRMWSMVTSRTHRCQDHSLRIEWLRESQLTAYIAQAFFDETRNDFGGVRRIAKQRPIDHGMSCLIPELGQMDMSIVHRHQPTTIFGTDRVCDLDYHF